MKENMQKMYGEYQKYYFTEVEEKVYQRKMKTEKIEYKGKTVLDIGAGLDSVTFFSVAGAKKIIAVDRDVKELRDKISEKAKHIEIIELEILSPIHFWDLIGKYRPDIVKIDVEGLEILLTIIGNRDILTIPQMYIIEIHQLFEMKPDEMYALWNFFARKQSMRIVGKSEFCHNQPFHFEFEDFKNIIIVIETR